MKPLIPICVRFESKAVPYVSVSDGVGKLVMRDKFPSEVSGQVKPLDQVYPYLVSALWAI